MSGSVGHCAVPHASGENRFMCISTVIITFHHVPSCTDEALNALSVHVPRYFKFSQTSISVSIYSIETQGKTFGKNMLKLVKENLKCIHVSLVIFLQILGT